MGKKIEIDIDQLGVICRLKPTLKDCAAFFKCSEDTIERRIKEDSGLTFAEFREQNMVHTRFNLIRKAIQKAEKGDNTMLIFSLKNLCSWKDKQKEEIDVVINDPNKLSRDELDREIDKLSKQLGYTKFTGRK